MRKELILKTVQEIPGVSFNEICRKTKLSNGVVSHYILQLVKEKKLDKFGDGRTKYFQPKVPLRDREIIVILRNTTNREIFKLLMKSATAVTSEQISIKIKKSRATVSTSLKTMQKKTLIERTIMNKKTKLSADIGFKINQRDLFEVFILKYNI